MQAPAPSTPRLAFAIVRGATSDFSVATTASVTRCLSSTFSEPLISQETKEFYLEWIAEIEEQEAREKDINDRKRLKEFTEVVRQSAKRFLDFEVVVSIYKKPTPGVVPSTPEEAFKKPKQGLRSSSSGSTF